MRRTERGMQTHRTDISREGQSQRRQSRQRRQRDARKHRHRRDARDRDEGGTPHTRTHKRNKSASRCEMSSERAAKASERRHCTNIQERVQCDHDIAGQH
eukprot:42294-Rhodomonas_salina.1